MAGLSGRNTKIAPSKLGCRLPFESVAVGDGYASAGKCDSRQMTPEERARYGPPKPRAEENPFRSRFRQAIKVSKSPEQAAELLGMTVGRLNQYLGANGLHPRWDKRKEDETVYDIRENIDGIVQEATESPENKASGVDEKQGDSDKVVQEQPEPEFYEASGGRRFTAERIARAEEVLSREEYVRLKNEGVADFKIIKTHKGFSSDLMIALKKKWGINIVLPSGPPKPQAKPVPPRVIKPVNKQEEPGKSGELHYRIENIRQHLAEREDNQPVQTSTSGLTIVQALELRDELTEDMKSWDVIHRSIIQGIELSARVVRILETQRDIHQTALNRINEAFERTVLPL